VDVGDKPAGARQPTSSTPPAALWLEGRVLATSQGGGARAGIEFRHPFYDRPSPVYLAEYVGIDAGTGIVHSRPPMASMTSWSGAPNGRSNDEILSLVQGGGSTWPTCPSSAA
jgi:isoleucyl-tRNA synthetase